MLNYLPELTVSFATSGFKITPPNVVQFAALLPTQDDTRLFFEQCLLSNSASMGTYEEGPPSPVHRDEDGAYHSQGSLTSVPDNHVNPRQLQLIRKNCR